MLGWCGAERAVGRGCVVLASVQDRRAGPGKGARKATWHEEAPGNSLGFRHLAGQGLEAWAGRRGWDWPTGHIP